MVKNHIDTFQETNYNKYIKTQKNLISKNIQLSKFIEIEGPGHILFGVEICFIFQENKNNCKIINNEDIQGTNMDIKRKNFIKRVKYN